MFWRGATPTTRSHLRLLSTLTLVGALPAALLLSLLSRLTGSDSLILFLFYFLLFSICFVLLDLVLGAALKVPIIQRQAVKGQWINLLPAILSGVFFSLGILALDRTLLHKGTTMRVLTIVAIMATSFLLAMPARYLVITRLYWHGVRPPTYRAYRMLTLSVVALVLSVQLVGKAFQGSAPSIQAQAKAAVVLLAFDIPEKHDEAYAEVFPDWERQSYTSEATSITDFWAGFGTGTGARVHGASLWTIHSPLFLRKLNRNDPTQVLPIALLEVLNLTQPVAGGGRYRKYFWEILDDCGLATYSWSFWHSFPAKSQNGGVLTERWEPAYRATPYLVGMTPLPGTGIPQWTATLPGGGRGARYKPLKNMAAREEQSWKLLNQQAGTLNFHTAVAYFPLSDNLERLPENGSAHETLATYRQGQLSRLLEVFGEDVAIGIVIASGKDSKDGVKAQLLTNPAWRNRIAPSFTSYLQVAPTILNYFGIPADKMMYEPSPTAHSPNLNRVDYGEPEHILEATDHRDTRYYQDLRALGYIR